MFPIAGNGKTLYPETALSAFFDATTPGTKSPSTTIAAFGLFVNTFDTDVGKSVCSAPDVPPAMLLLCRSVPIVWSAFTTDASVHLSVCFDNASYFDGPACRR